MNSTHHLSRFIILSALLAFLAMPVLAQPKPAKSDAKAKPTAAEPAKADDAWKRKLGEVAFDNIPLAEVASFLSEQFPEVNFVTQTPVRDIGVSLRLRSVTLDDILTALEISTKNATTTPVPGAVDPATGLPVAPASNPPLQITKMDERMVSFTVAEAQPPVESTAVCRAFSLSRNLVGKSDKEINSTLNDIEDALQMAWRMLQAADRSNTKVQAPQLSLHRATKLLIVVGQPSQVDVVEQVINQLENGPGFGANNPNEGGGRTGAGGFGGAAGAPAGITGGGGVPGLSPSTGSPSRGK